MLVSDCCSYEVMYHDICKSCQEHCEPYEEFDEIEYLINGLDLDEREELIEKYFYKTKNEETE